MDLQRAEKEIRTRECRWCGSEVVDPREPLDDPKKPKLIIPLVYHANSDWETAWNNGVAEKNKIYAEQFICSAGYTLAPYRYVDLIVAVAND